MRSDKHHVMHYRQEWTLRPEAKAIRDHPSLIPSLHRETHEHLHARCPGVPALGYQTLIRVLKNWYPQRDTLQSMGDLQYAIDAAAQHPQVHPIERELAKLTIEAIGLQKPWIEEGLIVPGGRTIIDLGAVGNPTPNPGIMLA